MGPHRRTALGLCVAFWLIALPALQLAGQIDPGAPVAIPIASQAESRPVVELASPVPLGGTSTPGTMVPNLASQGPAATEGQAMPLGGCALPCGGTAEGESCGTTSNNGCNMTPFNPANFRMVTCGETVCGTLWATGGSRDTD